MDFATLREQNIAKNRELLKQLEIKEAVSSVGLLDSTRPKPKPEAKPVKSSRVKKRKSPEPTLLRRQSSRLNKVVKQDETPQEKRERELRLMREEQERLEREEREREAKKPRHQDLDFKTLADELTSKEIDVLHSTFSNISSRATASVDPSRAFEEREVEELKKAYSNVKIVSRAKVTQDRVYSSLYHPDKTKDLIFFGDKHGQLGIWDARAEPLESLDEDGNPIETDSEEGGRIYRLQPHWPATSKSSISCIKLDPSNPRNIYTSAYDCTMRSISFESGISTEIFALDDTLISSFDISPSGHEMWISDAEGGITHKDVREAKSRARRYQLLETKTGCVSINPVRPEAILVSSNNKSLTLWDARKLSSLSVATLLTPPPSSPIGPSRGILSNSMTEIDFETIKDRLDSKEESVLMAKWMHQKSVSSAYWDPSGTRIVSTSYDDTLRLWNVDWGKLTADPAVKQYKPFVKIQHNCQTGKWLSILKSQWNQNPDVFPHFTVGNMNHSLNVVSGTGQPIATLSDRSKITAVQAVTCSHPGVVARVASGNASGRCVLWASESDS